MARAGMFSALCAAVTAAAGRSYLYYPNSDVNAVSETIFPKSNLTQNVSALSALCDATAGCIGFNLNGWLKNGSSSVGPQQVDLYLVSPSPEPPLPLLLWPAPASCSSGSTPVAVSPALAFSPNASSVDLDAAIARARGRIFTHGNGSSSSIMVARVVILVADVTLPLQVGVDESYNLNIPGDGSDAIISAPTLYGVYHALETLSQLIEYDYDSGAYVVRVAPVQVQDAPRFKWRGVMVDPARHFLPLAVLRDAVDSMTYAKLNVLHVHLVDCDSWPVEVPGAFANLWMGAFSPRERYTVEDLTSLVEYARQRGVRVVFEYDSPGHSGSMCDAYPQICPAPDCREPLNPASPDTLPAITSVISTLMAASLDDVIHLGGDEVDPACWLASPAILAWMQARGYNSSDDIYHYFVNYTNSVAVAAGRSPMRWEEVWTHFGTALDPSTIIHAWLSSASLAAAANAGYRTVFSVDTDAYYLDYLDVLWDATYNVDILANITFDPPEAVSNVLGGEVALWEETVDAGSLLSTLWPRAAAAAERLWSYNFAGENARTARSYDVVTRLAQFRCLLLERGVPVPGPGNPAAGSMGAAWTVGSCGGGYAPLC